MRTFLFGMAGALLVVASGCTHAVGDEEGTEASYVGENAPRAKILTVQYEVQQTGYWCGPTATRMALSARMNPPSQQALANQLGTTTNGTNWIGQITEVLNKNLGKKVYETREMPNDPPTATQKSRFWDDIVRSINANYPLVVNIVAPPNNHPPGYPNSTIYHYIAIIGYDPDGRQVYVADSANFSGKKLYWLTFDQMATLVPPKGYSSAVVADVAGCGAGKTFGAIATKYQELGGCGSILGAPLSDEKKTPDGVGRYNVFEKGSIYWTEKLGAHEVHGVIRDLWKTTGWESGILGYPVTDERGTPDSIGRYSVFERGSIYWTPKTGANEVHGLIRDAWKTLGWEAGVLGYPTSSEQKTADGVGRYNVFEKGAIYWTPKTGAHEVLGRIRDAWVADGAERGKLGYPTSGEYAVSGGRRSDFERGSITWTSATNKTAISTTP